MSLTPSPGHSTISFHLRPHRPSLVATLCGVTALWTASQPVAAWDYEAHRAINLLALQSLPTHFPAFAFAPAARERIAFLGGEADRWRNTPDLPLRHVNGPDHFLDLEELVPYGLAADRLPELRYEFVAHMARIRLQRPDAFAPIDPAKDKDRTRALPGFLPWAMVESYGRLKSAFSYLRAFVEKGTPEEVQNARDNALYVMGVMGHFAGDAAQPLHTTHHYNGWVGANPKRYTTNRTFHAWIDGAYFVKTRFDFATLDGRVRPARLLEPGPGQKADARVFQASVEFLTEQHGLVETLYTLEREGGLTGEGDRGREGLDCLGTQMLRAGAFLGDLWLSAWLQAPPDSWLQEQLTKRNAGKSPSSAQP